MLCFYDFEVFKYNWMVTIINPFEKVKITIIDDINQLKTFYDSHKDQIWIGYNSRSYDQYILKGILLKFNPWDINEWIIIKERKGWEYSSLFNSIQLYNYDCINSFHSLKTLEGFMGNNIKETSVNFTIDRPLTETELLQTKLYNIHDVEQTMEVFLKTKQEFDAHIALIKTFNLPISYVNKTQAQLAAIILGANKKQYFDEWDIRLPETLQLSKYKFIGNWFLDKENHSYDKILECDIAGVPHVIAWGGLHGAISKYTYECQDDEILVMADVDQLYPTLMIVYELLSRSVSDYDRFKEILSESLRLKKLKMKKEREPYKRICNITYGAEGDKCNPMYDPLHRTLVCVFGQVLMIDLIEKLESFCKLIQSNTDGILILIKSEDFDRLDDTVYEWEQRTGLHMSFDLYKKIIQKDVNNYVAIDLEDHIKSKGAYVKKLNDLDYDLPIVNKAMLDYMVKEIPVEDTINKCEDLKEFQKIYKITKNYKCAWHNNENIPGKTFRVFASKNPWDSYLGKIKTKKGKDSLEKFANCPEHCFIWNEDINGVKVPEYLDKEFYIKLAETRLNQFGL